MTALRYFTCTRVVLLHVPEFNHDINFFIKFSRTTTSFTIQSTIFVLCSIVWTRYLKQFRSVQHYNNIKFPKVDKGKPRGMYVYALGQIQYC